VNHKTSTHHLEKVIHKIKSSHLTLTHILETHVHADHLSGAQVLKQEFPQAKTMIGSNVTTVQKTFSQLLNLSDISLTGGEFDGLLHHKDVFHVGKLEGLAIHSPGHTPACMVYVIGDAVFTGDTIFMPDFGTARCDFPGGCAEQLYESVHKIFELPDDYRVFVGHDYGTDNRKPIWETTIHAQKFHNKQLNLRTSKDEFVAWRKARDSQLSLPKLIMQSLQVNLRNGRLPEAESNGQVYFKLPVNLK
jgi:glyoxylase-like metal-dependent hydrolase (beta-lactamase superfamily II)